ncbi:MAG TPA: MFS transporter, partial [Gammaproteobacteria bacterium]|nr:MFS transporter [Gammaproteobacteria bacterium]
MRRGAWRFVVVIGVVSLFADMAYEGARGIVGAYFYQLGAGALLVGVIGGGAEFLGYAVRWFAGRGADVSGRHWLFIYGGYALNMIAVPCLALTGTVGAAAALVAGERVGKGVRTPPRDALLARAGEVVGHGAGFGRHEFLDQLGAIAGPLIVAAVVVVAGYRAGFAVLAIPAAAALAALAFARRFEIQPRQATATAGRLPRAFWSWVIFAALATAGFAHFSLVAFDLAKIGFMPALIPVLFAVAMAAEGVAGWVFGHLSDRTGAMLLAGFPLCGLAGTVLLFL